MHYLNKRPVSEVATRMWPFFKGALEAAGLSRHSYARRRGRFTVVLMPVYHRRPLPKYRETQSNARMQELQETLINKVVATFGPIENGWSGHLGATQAGDNGTRVEPGQRHLRHGTVRAESPAVDTSGAADDAARGSPKPQSVSPGHMLHGAAAGTAASASTAAPRTLRPRGRGNDGNRILVLDVWRMTRALIETCPDVTPPFPRDGSHFNGAGDFILARLLLNTLMQDEARRAAALAQEQAEGGK